MLLSRHVGTVRFFHRHRWLVRGSRTRPVALRALRVAHVWIPILRRELRETRAALRPQPVAPKWLVDAFACIHHYEGSWSANTGNGYYGGLQMDIAFQSRYGADFMRAYGTADRWPIRAQLTAAVRAYQSGRGFYPWPNTARTCGLI